eukprot:973441-Pelagomonas_calceolata.AAC.1
MEAMRLPATSSQCSTAGLELKKPSSRQLRDHETHAHRSCCDHERNTDRPINSTGSWREGPDYKQSHS